MPSIDRAFAPGALPEGLAPGIGDTMERMGRVFASVARLIARGGLDEDLAGTRETNADGDTQKALDVIADDAFRAALAGGAVRHYASEEQEGVVTLTPEADLALAIDPLDGSSNIDTNVSIGAIFGLYPAAAVPEASFLRPGHELLAAGYAIYGPQCALVVSFGQGVLTFVLDPGTGQFCRAGRAVRLPEDAKEYAINASNRRHWQAPVRRFIETCEAGETGPLGRNFNMRWVASLVAETHRIVTRGGVFLYPADARPGYGAGRLRLVYECAPVAFLVEQAGGAATDGVARLLDRVPDRLHARTPLVFGSRRLVAVVAQHHADAG